MSTREKIEKELVVITDFFNLQSKCILNTAIGTVSGANGAQSTYDKCVADMKNAVDKTAQLKQSLKTSLDQMYAVQTETVDSVNGLDASLQGLEKEVEEARKLNEIRKEQAAALEKRSDGNYHSSWLGLWKPLRDEYRVGIAVIAMGMGLIAALLLGLLFYEGHIRLPGFFNRVFNFTQTQQGFYTRT